MTPRVTIEANDLDVYEVLPQLRRNLEAEGIASEIVGPDGLGAVEDFEPLIWIAVGGVIDHEIYPRSCRENVTRGRSRKAAARPRERT